MIREPIVAGQFYPGSPSSLAAQISKFIDKKAPKEEVIGIVSPHAGYMYSGQVAAYAYKLVEGKTLLLDQTGQFKLT